MYCTNCGKEINDDANFCSNCGKKLNIYKSEEKNKETSKEKKNSSTENYNLLNSKTSTGKSKKSSNLKYYIEKFLLGILAFIIPPIGIILVFKTSYFGKLGKSLACIWLGVILIGIFAGDPDNNESTVNEEEVVEETTNESPTEETDKTEEEFLNLIESEKGLVELDQVYDPGQTQSMLHMIVHGETTFKEPFVEKWNYTLENIQDDLEHVDDAQIDKNWWSWLELNESDIEPRNAPGWQENTDGGDIYDTTFGDDIEVEMTIYNPPMQEIGDNPDLNKFRLSISLVEDLSEINSTNNFLSQRRQAVQTFDVALRSILGKDNYNREELYEYISDFSEDGWNIERSNLDFEYEDWGYFADKYYDNYDVGIEIDETNEFESIFNLILDFELN